MGIQPLQYTVLTDQELTRIVTGILQRTPNSGETYVLGSLASREIRIQRWRVRRCLHACGIKEQCIFTSINLFLIFTVVIFYILKQEVDPIGRSLRRRHTIRRRVYNVQTPNQLW